MYKNEQLTLYKLAYYLVREDHYTILHINPEVSEIWLEKYENKVSNVIRLINKGFDWKNHLKKDIAIVFQKSLAMRRFLKGRKMRIYNVYVAPHTPVDDWEQLKKPMYLKDKSPMQMNVYYLDELSASEELYRFGMDAVSACDKLQENMDEQVNNEEEKTQYYKHWLNETLSEKQEEESISYSSRKPMITYFLMFLNAVMFLLLELKGGSTSAGNLISLGANYAPAIMDGQWWRIVTSMFLHIGFVHLFMNMLALYYVGSATERIYGIWRFLLIYFLAGIGGGIASFAMSATVSAGASGAIIGLFGAWLYFGLYHKKMFFQTIGKGIMMLIAVNIAFGFIVPGIDNSAHIGGLITGFLAAAIAGLPDKRAIGARIGAFVLYAVLITGLVYIGFQRNGAAYELVKITESLDKGNFSEAVLHASKGLEEPGEYRARLLFQRSYAYINMNKTDLAITDLEKMIRLTDECPEGYYNLALLYYQEDDQIRAANLIEKAVKSNPDNKTYQKLYDEIMKGKQG